MLCALASNHASKKDNKVALLSLFPFSAFLVREKLGKGMVKLLGFTYKGDSLLLH